LLFFDPFLQFVKSTLKFLKLLWRECIKRKFLEKTLDLIEPILIQSDEKPPQKMLYTFDWIPSHPSLRFSKISIRSSSSWRSFLTCTLNRDLSIKS